MNEIEIAAHSYVQNEVVGMIDHDIDSGDMRRAFVAGAKWQNDKDVVTASEAIQRAIIRHNAEEQKRMLRNYRQICGCFHKGLCTVDCKKCTFHQCETLRDLFKE